MCYFVLDSGVTCAYLVPAAPIAVEETDMKRELFFAISGAIGALFGLAFLLVPGLSLSNYGMPTDPANILQARYFGSALLAVGLIVFMARETQDAIAVRALLVGNAVADVAGALITFMGLGSLMNSMAWSSVVIYVAFAAGSLYFLLAAKPAAQAQSA